MEDLFLVIFVCGLKVLRSEGLRASFLKCVQPKFYYATKQSTLDSYLLVIVVSMFKKIVSEL